MLASQSNETEQIIKECTLAQSFAHVMCDSSTGDRNTSHTTHLTQWSSLLKGPGRQISLWLRGISEWAKVEDEQE